MRMNNNVIELCRKIENIHYVTGSQLSKSKIKQLEKCIEEYEIDYYWDESGCLILGRASESKLIRSLLAGEIRQMFSAHLDHPGATVISKISSMNGEHLYSALWSGTYRPKLTGQSLFICDRDLSSEGSVVVDNEINSHGERFIYFRSGNEWQSGDTLHYPHKLNVEEDSLYGWGLDDNIGCALVIDYLSRYKGDDLIGILTIGEETGSYGAKRFSHRIKNICTQKGIEKMPIVINIDTSAANDEINFSLGDGAVIRMGDRFGSYAKEVIDHLRTDLGDAKFIDINYTVNDAGYLNNDGWNVVGIAIPLQNIHNGNSSGVFVPESVKIADVKSAQVLLSRISNSLRKTNISTRFYPTSTGYDFIFEDNGHILMERIVECKNYTDFLINCQPYWLSIHKKYGLEPVKLSDRGFKRLRETILNGSMVLFDQQRIEEYCRKAVEAIEANIGSVERGDLKIVTFLCANFNACNMDGNICLSLDRLNPDDIERVLCHELTHWVYFSKSRSSYMRPLISTFLSEGLSCLLSKEMLDICDSTALSLESETVDSHKNDEKRLKNMMLGNINGKYLEFQDDGHHLFLNNIDLPDPFYLSNKESTKYGYYLAMEFVRGVSKKYQLKDVIENPKLMEDLLCDYLLMTN